MEGARSPISAVPSRASAVNSPESDRPIASARDYMPLTCVPFRSYSALPDASSPPKRQKSRHDPALFCAHGASGAFPPRLEWRPHALGRAQAMRRARRAGARGRSPCARIGCPIHDRGISYGRSARSGRRRCSRALLALCRSALHGSGQCRFGRGRHQHARRSARAVDGRRARRPAGVPDRPKEFTSCLTFVQPTNHVRVGARQARAVNERES